MEAASWWLATEAATGESDDGLNSASIPSEIKCKQEGLHEKIAYDSYPRKALVDHFLKPGLSLEGFLDGQGLAGDFHTGVYRALLRTIGTHLTYLLFQDMPALPTVYIFYSSN